MTKIPQLVINHKAGASFTLGAALLLSIPSTPLRAQQAMPDEVDDAAGPAEGDPEAEPEGEAASEADGSASEAKSPSPPEPSNQGAPAPSSTAVPQVMGVPPAAVKAGSSPPGSGLLGLPGKSSGGMGLTETLGLPSAKTGEEGSAEAGSEPEGALDDEAPQAPVDSGSRLDQAGVPLLMTAVGGWSGYTLGTIGALGRNSEVGVPMGVATGALVGAGSTYLLTRGREVSAERALSIINAEAWGTTIGWLGTAGQLNNLENPGRVGAVYGALGMGTGLLYGALNKDVDYRGINLGGLSGSMGALGLNLMLDVSTSEQALLATGGSVALGLGEMGLGILLDRDEPMSRADGGLAAHTAAHAMWIGAWAPGLFSYYPEEEQRFGGALLAGSGALMLSQVLSPRLEPDLDAVRSTSLSGGYGYLAGGGVPLMLGLFDGNNSALSDDYLASVGVISGGLTGLGLGAIRAKVRDDDALGLGHAAGAGVGLAHGLIIANAFVEIDGFTENQFAGVVLTSTGVGGMLGLMAPSVTKDQTSGIKPAAAATGFGWGAWYGGWGAAAAGLERPWVWTSGLLGADLGAGVGLLATRSGRELSARNMGYVSLCGVGGAALANVATLVATDDPQAIALANLAGGSLGLATGFATRGVLDKLMAKAPDLPDINLPNPLAEVGREASRWNPRFEIAPLPVLNPSPGEELPMGATLSLTQPVR